MMADSTTMDGMPEWVPAKVDLTRPNTARVYDYFLGGFHNFEVDRAHAALVEQVLPQAPDLARRARRFLRSAIDVLAREYGVDQFLDLGSGIPTRGNVEEIARKDNPAPLVVYVDNATVA